MSAVDDLTQKLNLETGNLKPKPILKILEVECRSDSGLADSRNVTFSPCTQVAVFSPLVKSPSSQPSTSEEVVPELASLNDSEIDDNNAPLQSSGINNTNIDSIDVSKIKDCKYLFINPT